MKNIKNFILGCGLLLLLVTSCAKDEIKYDTSVVRYNSLQLNGAPFKTNVGISTLCIFVYKDNGDYFGNYSSLYRFALDNGKYNFMATDIPAQMITSPVNLKDLVVPQLVTADQKVNLSAATSYNSPFADTLKMNILTRTGILRLKARDLVPDPSYSNIKVTVFVKRSGYKPIDETFVKEDMSVTRTKKTTTGGVNYLDDFIVFQTDDVANNVRVKIEFMDANSVVVNTKEFAGAFSILPNVVTNVDFNLNDPDTPTITDYVVTINGEVVPN